MENSRLSDGVFMARCDDDIVVLDTRVDLYSCLPEAAEAIALSPPAVEADDAILEQLAAAGFCDPDARSRVRSLPPLPRFALDHYRVAPTVLDRVAVVRGMAAAWREGPGRRPLAQLLPTKPCGPANRVHLERTARLTAAFVQLLPWDPAQGACLYRAWLLRRVLQIRGLDAIWVFGVRTWPFGAHCWLQIEDHVLDDDPDRVAQYTPIMAV